MKILTFIILIVTTHNISCAQKPSCDYFGLETPGIEAQAFNPEVLELEGSFVFNAIYNVPRCDEFYFTKIDSKENIYYSKKENGIWQLPQIASFSIQAFHDADPFFTLDGNRVYFVSSRPTSSSDTSYDYNIWYADKTNGEWSNPIVLPEPINTKHEEYFFAISNKGNAFFASDRPGGLGSFDIYKTQILEDGNMSKPVNIGAPINTKGYEFDPYISSDEQIMVFSINNEHGFSDLFFSYKNENGAWSEPINMGDNINTPREDFGPSISPDNQYIFFTNGGKLRWVSIKLLDLLKE